MKRGSDIAVVGMSCVFPGAGDLNSYWRNIINKVDALQDAPNHRIDKVFIDPTSTDADRLYVKRGGFIDDFVDFDPIEFGIVPKVVQGTEPDQLLALKLAYRALEDADVFSKKIPLQRAGIIIGKGGYGGVEMGKLVEMIIGAESFVRMLRVIMPQLSESELTKVKKEYQRLRGSFGPDNVMGTVPNLVAALVANRLDFGGPAYTVDAACASSLIAVDHAVKELDSGRCDLMIAGAIHVGQNPVLWSVFTMMGALSRNQVVRPFDKRADGVLTGEGCGFIVLRRLEDAIRDDQRIYAVIKGVGLSSDGANASIMSPSVIGQVKAIRNAWEQTNLDIGTVGYVEAHGTATVLGDKTELETLRQAFGFDSKLPRAGMGSVKSMIGHAMPAAGIAGLIKTTLALYHGKLPPTLHCEEPVEGLKQTRFDPVQEAVDWDQTGLPRLAGVNAFGFGGANAHAVVEAFNISKKLAPKSNGISVRNYLSDEVILLARQNADSLIKALESGEFSLGSGSHRLALFNPTPERIKKAVDIIRKGILWRNRLDMWYTHKPLLEDGGKLAFVFPGLDGPSFASMSVGKFDEVARHFKLPIPEFGETAQWMEMLLRFDESCRLIDKALKKLNIEADVVTGHSVGEWNACYAAGMVDDDVVKKLEVQNRDKIYEKNDGAFLSAGCGYDTIAPLLKEHPGIYLSNDNCPHQVILSGTSEDIDKFRADLNKQQIINHLLPFQTGYHSPFAERYLDEVKANLRDVVKFNPPRIPVWSGITAAPYPVNVDEIKQLHLDFMTKPVLFRQLTQRLYDDGVKLFLQIGAGSLIGFIDDTLKGKEFASIASASTSISAMQQLQRVVAALFVEGKEGDLSFLNTKKSTVEKAKPKGLSRKLDLGLPMIGIEAVLSGAKISQPGSVAKESNLRKEAVINKDTPKINSHPLLNAFQQNMEQMNVAQREILELLSKKGEQGNSKNSATTVIARPQLQRKSFTKKMELSLKKYPELLDHSPFRKRSTVYNFDNEREPVVPLTMFIQLFAEIALEEVPQRKISKIENINIYQFYWAIEATFAEIQGEWKDSNIMHLKIDKYVNADIVFGEKQLNAPSISKALGEYRKLPIVADDVYKKGYLFHGASYQGIRSLDEMGDKGIKANISENVGKGSLLDNAGQLIALWYHLMNINTMPFPVKIREIQFYGNILDQKGTMECTCVFTDSSEEFLVGDIQLMRDNKPWAFISGWQNRKSEIDKKLWDIMTFTEDNFLCEDIGHGISLFERTYKRVNSWVFIMNHYLNKHEIEFYKSLTLAKQTSWLMGRVAAKDAVRKELIKNKQLKMHPAALTIKSDELGRPLLSGDHTEGIAISIAHKEDCAVAISRTHGNVGIDLEVIKERDSSFTDMVLSEKEKALLPTGSAKAEWITRCWVAKEAYGKSIGKGLNGGPRNYTISKIEKDIFWINDISIKTINYKNYIIGWTQ